MKTNNDDDRTEKLLQKLEASLTHELEVQRLGPQTWRTAWLRALDRIYKPFEG